MKFRIFIPLLLASIAPKISATSNPSCPTSLKTFDPIPEAQSSPFTERFVAYAHALSSTPWFVSFAKNLYPRVVHLFSIIKENEREYAGWSIPYPKESLYDLYNYINDRKLHCYAKKNPYQLLVALVTVTTSSGYGGMSDISDMRERFREIHGDEEELRQEAIGGVVIEEVEGTAEGVIDQQQAPDAEEEEEEEIDPAEEVDASTYFQYINTQPLLMLHAIVDNWVFQLQQIEAFAVNQFSRHEMSLLKAALDWWRMEAFGSLDRTVTLIQDAETYLREPGAFDLDDAAQYLDADAEVWVEPQRPPLNWPLY
ncbi:hypothetical protein TWF694_011525 [Orbilia ellipsospora]|uniref:Uncharacterized protein n=1 Tax=Orbilia ellipsospora TaxID=2528407 RepID=A0AAV9X6K8_9PEZI